MKARIITIGDELLHGHTVDTNSAWLSGQLGLLGINTGHIASIGDQAGVIAAELDRAVEPLIIVTGGLGPTRDDITKKAICRVFATKLVRNERALENVERFVRARSRQMNEHNRAQADIPAIALPLENRHGTAPGLWIEQKGRIFVFLPGVPHEMKQLFSDEVKPLIEKLPGRENILHRWLQTSGISEAELAERLAGWEQALPSYISVAYLPEPGLNKIRLSARGRAQAQMQAGLQVEIARLEELIGPHILGHGNERPEEQVADILRERGHSLSLAESCTGGALSAMIVARPGSSGFYKGGVVAYSNKAKTDILGVKLQTLQHHGAVSRQTAIEMARGARRHFSSVYSLAITGIAGPEGGTPDKPVGTVWIALNAGGKEEAGEFRFGTNREVNIRRACRAAINMLLEEIKKVR